MPTTCVIGTQNIWSIAVSGTDLTQEPYQPTKDEIVPVRPKHKGLSEQQRQIAHVKIREWIVQGVSDTEISKRIQEQFSVSRPTATKYLNKAYADINAAKVDESVHDRDLNLYLALERYKVALRLAMERKDIKNILIANQRISELQGIVPTKEQQPLINMHVNHLPGITNQQVMTMPTAELERLVSGQRKLEHKPEEVLDAEFVTQEEAEAMLRGQ